MKIFLPMIELFYGHRCNLACTGCTSMSDVIQNYEYDPTIESILESIDNLSNHVDVGEIDLMGGEALLYWDLIELISSRIREKFPNTVIGICTNGLLLEKFESRIIDFSKKYHPCVIDITNHFKLFSDDVISKKFQSSLKTFLEHVDVSSRKSVTWGVTNDTVDLYSSPIANIRVADAENFYSCYYTNVENKIKPFATNDPAGSYKNGCAMPNCHLLYESKLYKCSWFALLPKLLKIKNQLDDSDWAKYLNYKAIDLKDCSYSELQLFADTANKHIDLCDMCSNNKKFEIKHNKENVINIRVKHENF